MNRQVLKLAIPSILANITIPLVGMVDVGIAGRLGDAALIGAIAISSMLFDLLYWNMGFLRIGTGGMVAQAFGANNFKEAMRVFNQGIITALGFSLFFWIIQWWYVDIALNLIDCSPDAEKYVRQYFFIRIWAAPATLSLLVFKGFFIGMQNTVIPMVTDITVNVVNFGASVYLALYTPIGFNGIALGTVIAQYTGFLLAIALMLIFFRKYFKYITLKECFHLKQFKRFFLINKDLFVRSICFLFIYAGFTSLSAHYGDTELAVCSILIKLMMVYSYFTDGFAYAGEALAGRYIGAGDDPSLRRAIRVIFHWTIWLGVVSAALYWFGGEWMCSILTDNADVLERASYYLGWLLVMPILSCLAFTWDGIYIGATASKAIRNSMVLSVIGFFAVYYAFKGILGINALWAGYMMHLVVRSAYLTIMRKRYININERLY